jgi:hypothetical protein
MTDLDAVLAADQARTKAMVDRDLDTLDALIEDGCRYVHSTGAVDTKESYLAKLADGTFGYTWITAADQHAVDLGSAVLVSFTMEAELLLNGVARPYRSRAVVVWRVTGSGPRMVYFQATTAPS